MITCYCHSVYGTLLAERTFRSSHSAELAARWSAFYADCGAITIVEQEQRAMKHEAIIIYADSARGQYIPQFFAESIKPECLSGISWDDMDVLEAGPEHEWYWEAWNSVLSSAVITLDGNEYRLHQDGDLFAICDALMSDDEYEEFFGEPRDEPRDEREPETWTFTIETGNAAFDGAPASEIARILRGIAEHIEQHGYYPAPVFDVNGNRCGTVTVD